MRKLVGHRLTLVGIYLFIGMLLTVLGRSNAGSKGIDKLGKQSNLKQEIVSAFRNLMAQDITRLILTK